MKRYLDDRIAADLDRKTPSARAANRWPAGISPGACTRFRCANGAPTPASRPKRRYAT